jgi:peptidoglycan/LPS O-acetylase OafA/YrhL
MTEIRQHSGFYIPSLDGMRAVAAMLVFVAHAGWSHVIPGGFGVTIFFFLSGYLITTLLRREFEHTGTISLGNFYLRRAYRIFPPLYLVLLLVMILALAGVIEHEMRPWAVASQILYWTNYYLILYGGHYFVPGTGVYWSLAIEEHFYFVFPLIFWVAVRRMSYANVAVLLFVICMVGLVWRYWLILEAGMTHNYTYHATDTRFDSLLFGCILGIWKNPVSDPEWKIGARARGIVLFCAVIVLLGTFLYRNETFRETARYTVQGMALFPVFWLAIRHPDWMVFRWLNWPPVRFFGVISYTFYLSHLVSLYLADRWTGEAGVLRALLGFAIAVMFAVAMYFVVEKPVARLRRRLHRD